MFFGPAWATKWLASSDQRDRININQKNGCTRVVEELEALISRRAAKGGEVLWFDPALDIDRCTEDIQKARSRLHINFIHYGRYDGELKGVKYEIDSFTSYPRPYQHVWVEAANKI